MAKTLVRVGIKVAQMTVLYDDAREAWLEADRLGFEPCWLHDRVLNQKYSTRNLAGMRTIALWRLPGSV